MSRISTHVLDTARGRPAAGVTVVLEAAGPDGNWTERGRGVTDADGRVHDLCPQGTLGPGDYQLRFGTGEYLDSLGQAAFYPEVLVRVRIDGATGRYHLPLLLSPFGYATYRGT
jgi:5-hydroxyisourate hydrolase